jgi:hypothetical protein
MTATEDEMMLLAQPDDIEPELFSTFKLSKKCCN